MSDMAINETGVDIGAGEHAAKPAARPGAMLARRRQECGLTIEEVAKQLNLAPRQIQAIEDENYAALPGMASVRGFIRSYARLLKIDAAPVLEMVAKESVNLQEPVMLKQVGMNAFSEIRLPRLLRPGFPLMVVLGAGILVLFLGGGFVLQQMGRLQPFRAIFEGKIPELSFASNPVPEVSSAKGGNAAASGDAVPVPSVNADTIAAPIVALAEPKPASEPQSGVAQQPLAAPATANLLVLKMSQDSWVEALRANHSPLVSRLIKAGTTETIEINEPVMLTIGNAVGVDVTWRGNRLDMRAGAKNNVYRINLK